jgi:hypothetical protein
MADPLGELAKAGVAIWLDDLRRAWPATTVHGKLAAAQRGGNGDDRT